MPNIKPTQETLSGFSSKEKTMSIEDAIRKALDDKGINLKKEVAIISNCNSNYIRPRVKTKHVKHAQLGGKVKDTKKHKGENNE